MKYYCDAAPDHTVTIHKGGKDGPVLATATPPDKDGNTEILIPGSGTVIALTHVKPAFLHIHPKTEFTYLGKKYHWKGHTGLVEDETGTLLAIYHSSWFNRNWLKVGRLEVTYAGQKSLDMCVITGLIVQERSDEEHHTVLFSRSRALTCLEGIATEACERGGRSVLWLMLGCVM
jgi:Family of unknown function (DUF6593)